MRNATVAVIPNGNLNGSDLDLVRLIVKKGRVPRWFQRISDAGGFNRDGAHPHSRWYDHPALGDDDSLIVEPYVLYTEELRDVLAFADRHDLDVRITGVSAHYPSHSFNVRFTPRKEKGAT